MAITYRAGNFNADSAGSTTPVFKNPATVVAGDIWIVSVICRAGSGVTISGVLSGLNLISRVNSGAGATTCTIVSYWYLCQGTETPSGSQTAFTLSASSKSVGLCDAFSGVITTAPIVAGSLVTNFNAAGAALVTPAAFSSGQVVYGASGEQGSTTASGMLTTGGSTPTVSSNTTGGAAATNVGGCAAYTTTAGTSNWQDGTAGTTGVTQTFTLDVLLDDSPALELSSFGTLTGPGSGDTIVSVTATVNQYQSSSSMQAPTYQLWDGTTAQIGSTQTGTASTSSTNQDNVVFTGVSYPQLATLRLRVYGHGVSGGTQSVDSAALTVNYTVNAGAATAFPAAVACITAVPAPQVVISRTATPTSIACITAVPAPTVSGFWPKAITLTDTFSVNGVPDTTKWIRVGTTADITVASQQLQITPSVVNTYDYAWAGSGSTFSYFDLTGSSITLQLVNAGNQGGSSALEIYIVITDTQYNAATRNEVYWYITEGHIESDRTDNGTGTLMGSQVTYSPTNHQWLRVREAAGTIYCETSANGMSWSAFSSGPTIANANRMGFTIAAGIYASQAASTVITDNLNVVNATVTPTAIVATTVIPVPTVSGGSAASVSPTAIVATTVVPAPTVSAGGAVPVVVYPGSIYCYTRMATPSLPQIISTPYLQVSSRMYAPADPVFPASMSTNGRHFFDAHGNPWPMIGDTVFGLVCQLSQSDVDFYLTTRAGQGYNCIYTNIVYGLYDYQSGQGPSPFARSDWASNDATPIPPFLKAGGVAPVIGTDTLPAAYDISQPNPAYLVKLDYIVTKAASLGIHVLINPFDTALDQSDNPGFLAAQGLARCGLYGAILGNRYKASPNVSWQWGNDYGLNGGSAGYGIDPYLGAISLGIRSAAPNQLQSIELFYNTSNGYDNTNWGPTRIYPLDWCSVYDYSVVYARMLNAYNGQTSTGSSHGLPTTPSYFVEGTYEDGIAAPLDSPSAFVCRMDAYYTLCCGGVGGLYGNGVVFPLAGGWQSYLTHPGAVQCGYIAQVIKAGPWHRLVPDASATFLTSQGGTFTTTGGMTAQHWSTAAVTPQGDFGVVYTPTNQSLVIAMTKMRGSTTARWWDPTNATYSAITGSPFANTGSHTFTPATTNSAGGTDWLLVLTA